MADERIETPSLGARLKHHLLKIAPEERYRSWVESDLRSRWWPYRAVVAMFIWYAVGAGLVMLLLTGIDPWFFVGSAIGLALTALILSLVRPYREWIKRRTLRSYERRWAKSR